MAKTRLQPNPQRFPGCPSSRARVLTVMQWNIHSAVTGPDPKETVANLAAEIRALDPDLVTLNEVDKGRPQSARVDHARYLARHTELRHRLFGPAQDFGEEGQYGNAVLSRFPIVDVAVHPLPVNGPEETRALVVVTINVAGTRIQVATAHLTQSDSGATSRAQQTTFIAKTLDTTIPTVFGSDVNALPRTRPWRLLRQHLIDAWAETGSAPGYTMRADNPQRRIDFIMYNNGFTAVPGSGRVAPQGSSDHRAVLTDLKLTGARRC